VSLPFLHARPCGNCPKLYVTFPWSHAQPNMAAPCQSNDTTCTKVDETITK
jgi:hypothetical protein